MFLSPIEIFVFLHLAQKYPEALSHPLYNNEQYSNCSKLRQIIMQANKERNLQHLLWWDMA